MIVNRRRKLFEKPPSTNPLLALRVARLELRQTQRLIDHRLKEAVECEAETQKQFELIGEILSLENQRGKLRREADHAMRDLRQAFYLRCTTRKSSFSESD